jgi:hypothetical protein
MVETGLFNASANSGLEGDITGNSLNKKLPPYVLFLI